MQKRRCAGSTISAPAIATCLTSGRADKADFQWVIPAKRRDPNAVSSRLITTLDNFPDITDARGYGSRPSPGRRYAAFAVAPWACLSIASMISGHIGIGS